MIIAVLFSYFVLSFAKEFKPCNPTQDPNCPGRNNALGDSILDTFKVNSPYFQVFSERGSAEFTNDGLKLRINQRFDNPSIRSSFYILFGKIEVLVKSAPGKGIVSSVFLQSDDLDEIDLEWIGGQWSQVQTNYFVRGDTSDYTRGGFHFVPNTHTEYHNYTIDWRKDSLDFFVQGDLVRTVKNNANNPHGYPQTPMAIFLGIWVGGDPSNLPGTIEWAGGLTNFDEAPFEMGVERIVVTDYSSGTEYRYMDQSGKVESIQTVEGEVNGRFKQASKEFQISSATPIEDLELDSKISQNKRSTFIRFSKDQDSMDKSFESSSGAFRHMNSFGLVLSMMLSVLMLIANVE